MDHIEKEAILSYLEPRAGMSVLDVGCGTGNYSLALAKDGLLVTGIDISTAKLDRARATAKVQGVEVEFLQGDARQLPFRDASFDGVISVSALEFVPNLSLLKELLRFLKPSGKLVVGVVGKNSVWGHFYAEKARKDPESVFTFTRARLYSLKELQNAMPGRKVQTRAVLFIPPDFDFSREQEALKLEAEAVKAGRTDGGFICAMSVK